MKRVYAWPALVCAAVAATSGCVTRGLFEDHYYKERVSSVLMSTDSIKLVVLGEKYHYVFEAPTELMTLLNSPARKFVAANLRDNFKVDIDGNVSGAFQVSTVGKLTEEVRQAVRDLRFEQVATGQFTQRYVLKGTRYGAANFSEEMRKVKLNFNYEVGVEAELSRGESAIRALATPVTVAADGVIILGAVVLSPILIPIALSNVCMICP